MDDRRLNFGPRFSADADDWVNEDGSKADVDDVGLEVAVDPDGGVRISIGPMLEPQAWELTPAQREQLAAFLVGL